MDPLLNLFLRKAKIVGRSSGTTLSAGDIRTNVVGSSFSSMPLENKNLASLPACDKGSALPPSSHILVNDNIGSKPPGSGHGSVLPNSSIGDKSGVGVTGSTPPNPSVGGIILANGSGSIHASNTYQDTTATCASDPSANSGCW